MKALTLHQPWASLIAAGAKRIETRGWTTNHRGPIAIHAGLHTELQDVTCWLDWLCNALFGTDWPESLPNGGVVAVAHLQACVPTLGFAPSQLEAICGNFGEGRYAWTLQGVIALPKPLIARGKQGLWELDAAGLEESLASNPSAEAREAEGG